MKRTMGGSALTFTIWNITYTDIIVGNKERIHV